jgi:flagellar FliL protein
MLNVFVISSDKRVDSLIEYFQPFFKAKIRCASDFDNGLKEVFENRPSVVFVQSTIGTVSGETVSRHIKSLLGSASPRIVSMGDIDSKNKRGTSWCDDWINVSDSVQQMRQDFAELMSRSFPEDWREIQDEIIKSECCTAETLQEFGTSEEESSAEKLSRENVLAEVIPGISPEIHDASISANGTDSFVEESELNGNIDDDEFPAYQNLYDDPMFERIAPSSKRRFVRTFLAIVVLLAFVGGCIYFLMVRKNNNLIPAGPLQSTSKPESESPQTTLPRDNKDVLNGLPSFLNSEWKDAQYTSLHPGWERYLSPEVDFRIYRDKGRIKAIQGISLTGTGLKKEFLTQILSQLGINEPLPSGKETSENGFRVEAFQFPGVAELVTYHEQGSVQIKAFVLEFS